MKSTDFIRILVVTLLIGALDHSANAGPHNCESAGSCPSCWMDLRVLYQGVHLNRVRTGMGGFENVPGQPSRMYRSYSETFSQETFRNDTNAGGLFKYSYTYNATWPTDNYELDPGSPPEDCVTLPNSAGTNGNYSFNGWCDTVMNNCSSTITGDVWSNPNCEILKQATWDSTSCQPDPPLTNQTSSEIFQDNYHYTMRVIATERFKNAVTEFKLTDITFEEIPVSND